MTLLDAGLFFAASFVGAAINSVAGGGTFIIFPTLIFGGLTPLAANVTSTVAVWPGTLTSVIAYRTLLARHKHRLAPFLLMSLAGGALGSAILLMTPEKTFEFLVPWLLLMATLIFTFGRHLIPIVHRSWGMSERTRFILGLLLQLSIATYGGYFGAGMGILMLAMLQLLGFNHVHEMNAFKAMLGAIINSISVIIFIVAGKVVWPAAAVMIVGASLGGYFGAHTSLKVAPEKIRLLVSVIGFTMTIYFFLK